MRQTCACEAGSAGRHEPLLRDDVLSIGAPVRVVDQVLLLFRDGLRIGSVGLHDPEVVGTSSVADEGDPRPVRSTNPIENLHGTLKNVSRNVKRWRSGSMALRWAVSGLMEAEKKFRRVKGFREMPQLIAAIEATIGSVSMDKKARIA